MNKDIDNGRHTLTFLLNLQLIESGLIGPRGPPGECSCNLTTLFGPDNIPELLPGPPGNPGTDGKMGLTGLPVSKYDYCD